MLLFSLLGACSTLSGIKKESKMDSFQEKEATTLIYQDFMFLKSQLLIYSGQLSRAKDNLETYLSGRRDSESLKGIIDLKIMLARLLMRQGNFSGASQVYFNLLTKNYENTGALSEVARFFYTAQSYEQALVLYKHLITVEPKNENHLIYAGLISLDLKQYKEAKSFFSKILKNFPESKHLGHFYLGHLAKKRKKYKSSLWHYDQCTKKAPTSFSACVLDQSEVLYFIGQKSEAYDVLKVFLKSFKDESVLKKIINMYFEDFNHLEALTYMFELEKLKPYDMNVKRKLGYLLMTNNDLSEALTRFQLVSANDEALDEDHINVLRVLQASQKSEKAINFVKSLAKSKTLGEDFFVKKQSYAQDEVSDFERLCPHVKKENKSHCYYGSGLAFLSKKNFKKASKSFKKVLSYDKRDHKSLYRLGRIYLDYDGKEKKGLKYVKRALDIEPSYALALNFMSYIWAEKGINLSEALSYSQRALGQEPNNGHYLDTFGYVLYRMGEYENALPVLKRAARLIPNNAEVYEHIADVYAGLDKPNKALSFYELALTLLRGENLERLGGKIARFRQNNSVRIGAVRVNKSSATPDGDAPVRLPAAFKED